MRSNSLNLIQVYHLNLFHHITSYPGVTLILSKISQAFYHNHKKYKEGLALVLLLNLLNELEDSYKMRGLQSILSFFLKDFNS